MEQLAGFCFDCVAYDPPCYSVVSGSVWLMANPQWPFLESELKAVTSDMLVTRGRTMPQDVADACQARRECPLLVVCICKHVDTVCHLKDGHSRDTRRPVCHKSRK